jgi:diguanylate cyclase (GGDEF)-like protein/PAS domain S-box-containing protein
VAVSPTAPAGPGPQPTSNDVVGSALHELPEALVLVYDRDLSVVALAGHALQRLSDPDACRPGQPLARALPGELWQRMQPLLASALAGETRSREIWLAGSERCLSLDAGPLVAGERGQRPADRGEGIALLLDVTVRRRAQLLHEQPHGVLDDAIERARRPSVGIGLLDGAGRWQLASRALCDITGYTAEELLGTRLDGIVHPTDVDSDSHERQRLLTGEIPVYEVRKRYFDAAGETVSALLTIALVRDGDGAPLSYVVQLQDESERLRTERDLLGLADHDQLTGLRNRRLFANDLRLQVARSRRYDEVAGLMVIDFEEFRRVSREDGHDLGDDSIVAVAHALSRRLRETDLAGRISATQLAVLLPHIDEDGLAVVAEGLQRVIAASAVEVGDEIVHPWARIGYTLVRAHTGSPERALSEAQRMLAPDAGGGAQAAS